MRQSFYCRIEGFQIACAALLLSVLGGCATLGTAQKSLLAAGHEADPAVQLASHRSQPAGPAITVEIRASGKKPEIQSLTLPGPLRIQQVLEQMGLVKRFRRMDIVLMRATGNERHKFQVKYDHTTRTVDPLYDYALYPGDHLVVIQDTRTVIDDMVKSITDPILRAAQR